MKERPILFSAPMVRAILDGTKTQTRRVFNARVLKLMQAAAQIGEVSPFFEMGSLESGDLDYILQFAPYGIEGDRLWVKETFKENVPPSRWIYRATDEATLDPRDKQHWKPSIFMSRRASRITLEIVSVRVERVQEISEEDVKAEGVRWYDDGKYKGWECQEPETGRIGLVVDDPRTAFMYLWDSINAKRGFGWQTNPWVWAITFKRIQ